MATISCSPRLKSLEHSFSRTMPGLCSTLSIRVTATSLSPRPRLLGGTSKSQVPDLWKSCIYPHLRKWNCVTVVLKTLSLGPSVTAVPNICAPEQSTAGAAYGSCQTWYQEEAPQLRPPPWEKENRKTSKSLATENPNISCHNYC
jgi:hypothetical protein